MLFAELDFASPPWDVLSGGQRNAGEALCSCCVSASCALAVLAPHLTARKPPPAHQSVGARPPLCAPPADAARDFVQACLQRDEKARPTAEQLLEHPWLQDEVEVSDAPFDDTIVQRLQRFGLYGRWAAVVGGALEQNTELQLLCAGLLQLGAGWRCSPLPWTRMLSPLPLQTKQVPPGGAQGAHAQRGGPGGGGGRRGGGAALQRHAPRL